MNFIQFHWVECKNLAAVGNMPIRIQLDKSPTTVVLGSNGAGKSSLILDSVCFALYGRPFRNVSKNQLVNNKNGRDLRVEIEFTRGCDKVRVVRGIRPNVFEIYVNDKLVDQSSKLRDYQKFFEETILGIDYVAFTQIVMIGKANYVPFMALNAGSRRLFVERVLGLDVFKHMVEVHKQQVDTIKQQVAQQKTDIRLVGEKIKGQERIIAHIEETSKKSVDEKRAVIQGEIDNLVQRESELISRNDSIKTELASIDIAGAKESQATTTEMLAKLHKLVSQIEGNDNLTTRELAFFAANDTCPTCTQQIDASFKQHAIEKRQARQAQLRKSIDELNERCQQQSQAQKEAVAKLDRAKHLLTEAKQVSAELSQCQAKQKDLTSQLDSLIMDTSNADTEREAMSQMKVELGELMKSYNELLEEQKYLDFISLCLKDSGIKSTIINEYIPSINNIVNSNIKQLGLFATVKLDDQFSEEIKIRGFEAMTYNQLSEGEKLRLDMAIMMAWRDIAKLKSNMSCNLLIMDEIFDSSVDAEGTTAFTDLLKSVSNLNVFVITHTPEKLADSFRSFIKLEKTNGFTTLSQTGTY